MQSLMVFLSFDDLKLKEAIISEEFSYSVGHSFIAQEQPPQNKFRTEQGDELTRMELDALVQVTCKEIGQIVMNYRKE